MQLLTQMKQKTMLFLLLSTCILIVSFIFISCGTDPQLKITDPDTGQFALDFSNCPVATPCKGVIPSTSFENDTSKQVAGKELTIEAWVKSQAVPDNALNGGIFARFDVGGIALYAKDGKATAAIRRVGGTGTATFTADYIVSSTSDLVKDVWTHVAAVLTSSDHSGVHADCANRTDDVVCTDAGTTCNDRLHLDLYTNGEYTECNTTYGFNKGTVIIDGEPVLKKDPATAPDFAGEPFTKNLTVGEIAENIETPVDGIDQTVTFNGVVDEARLWGVDRTVAEIQACMGQELSNDSGTCGRRSDNLIGYIRMNEGTGSTINDWSGLGAGALEYTNPNADEPGEEATKQFKTGWTPGAPLTKHD